MAPTPTQVPVWDLPIRLFHWLLVLLIGFSWLTESMEWMELHYLSGESILALLLFRVVWGFLGSEPARFRSFLRSPRAALGYFAHIFRREPDAQLGHNAAGGWMVVGILLLLFAQVGTGLFSSDDDAMIEGPLRHLVSADASAWLSDIHSLIFTLIQIVVVVHVCAIAGYFYFKGQNLLGPMITGRKSVAGPVTPPSMAGLTRAMLVLVLAVIAVVALVRLA